MPRPAPVARVAPLVLLALILAACGGPTVPLTQTVRVDEVVTGWFDAGVTEDGRNKIVPSVSLRLTNTGAAPTGSVQLNCIFRRVGDPDEWSAALISAVDRSGLAPGTTSRPIVVRGTQGYTGLQPRSQLLENRLFIDAKVEIFGKHGSTTWVKLGDFKIDRQLLTQ
jgi:hypothetical protein